MEIVYWILVFVGSFCFMEFMAWFTHKYIMHGFLWHLHKDHHRKDHDSWFERNDAFFIFYALVSIVCFCLWKYEDIWFCLPIALGIFCYGCTYFLVHDIFIHQRFKIFRNANNRYAKGIRRAHKMHHKHLGKNDGECFGMLFVPLKYFKVK
ncbi:sterol desaturase family protein [Mangrovimonas sp. AS39]|uniref:sterol desaturase family protein n=1 Tax=Mangrovimonas TaxID=1211036 RepID=UPI0006B5F791|nr:MULTISPECIES: sterol desaturase family protein [Mangrovimonas]MCF1191904.1 sterol desaturase family protein [Mangrovimonas futianensis]MCF1195599.1 sterol desaturase family protein [Mangrovimonas futianensis]MCF1422430.1 sterol desaturase family protein [Mangrovimonas futianensis]NIK92942.1 beta-carotene hydroxylase [Mangrovimonas sp. CR14]